jgi:hypothetical protein
MEHHPIEYNGCVNALVKDPGMRRQVDVLPHLFLGRYQEIRFEPVTFALEGPDGETLQTGRTLRPVD